MNRQITRLAVVGLVLLAALVVGTTYWQAWAASGLADRQDNSIQRVAEFSVKRGKIYAADGRTVLADNVRRKVDGRTLYFRKYPQRGLAAHIVGYSTQVRSRAGLEASQNDFLTGSNTNLSTVLDTTFDKLKGTTVEGNDLHLTLRPGAQRIALNALGGKCGAAVALEPRTGRLLVSVSSPTYDPNLIETQLQPREQIEVRLPTLAEPRHRRPVRAWLDVQGRSPQRRRSTPRSTPRTRRSTTPATASSTGSTSTTTTPRRRSATSPSPRRCSTRSTPSSATSAWLWAGGRSSRPRGDFGFYSVPPLETPVNERAISGLYNENRLFFPKIDSQADPGRLAFGQGPENAEHTGDPAADGDGRRDDRQRRPRHATVRRRAHRRPDGNEVTKTKPDILGRAVSEHTASEVARMMEAVVSGGTGTAAQIQRHLRRRQDRDGGERVARAGTRLGSSPSRLPTTPESPLRSFLERQSGTGGTTAAPIAKSIMEALLR